MRHPILVSLAVGTLAGLAFATPALAWHITSRCGNQQWVVGVPNEQWATGTTATFDFDQGPDATAGKGQSVIAPAAATSVSVSFSNSGEVLSASRPEGCVVPTTTTLPPATTTTTTVAVPAPTTLPPTTTLPPATTLDPAPTVVVAVIEPPVPPTVIIEPEVGVLATLDRTLPITGDTTDLLTLVAAEILLAGVLLVVLARRQRRTP